MSVKVVWLSMVDLTIDRPNKSGTWIYSMFKALNNLGGITIVGNLLFANQQDIGSSTINDTIQYKVPYSSIKNNIISEGWRNRLVNIILYLKPDIIHIWGTESPWCSILNDYKFNDIKKLIEIQGLKFFWGEKSHFYGNLNYDIIKKEEGILELLHPAMKTENIRKSFERWGDVEKCILRGASNINTQSQWVRDVMKVIAPQSTIYNTKIILRDSFLYLDPWFIKHKSANGPVIFTTSAAQPYKGLDVTISAFRHVLQRYPTAKLRVAGVAVKHPQYRNVAYVKYLIKLCKQYGITEHVAFLGNLDEITLVKEMYNADVFVNSSFIESYCLALAEALSLGVPCVASYTSALSELITDKVTGLYYPMGDDYICAVRIINLIENIDWRKSISKAASSEYRAKNSPIEIAENQLRIYNSLLK